MKCYVLYSFICWKLDSEINRSSAFEEFYIWNPLKIRIYYYIVLSFPSSLPFFLSFFFSFFGIQCNPSFLSLYSTLLYWNIFFLSCIYYLIKIFHIFLTFSFIIAHVTNLIINSIFFGTIFDTELCCFTNLEPIVKLTSHDIPVQSSPSSDLSRQSKYPSQTLKR